MNTPTAVRTHAVRLNDLERMRAQDEALSLDLDRRINVLHGQTKAMARQMDESLAERDSGASLKNIKNTTDHREFKCQIRTLEDWREDRAERMYLAFRAVCVSAIAVALFMIGYTVGGAA